MKAFQENDKLEKMGGDIDPTCKVGPTVYDPNC